MPQMTYRLEDVFTPASFPSFTYVSRESDWEDMTYEERLEAALSIKGFLTYIVGNSKIGKTVLCKKVIPEEALISVSGADFSDGNDFWTIAGQQAGMSVEGSSISASAPSDLAGQTTQAFRYKLTKDKVIDHYRKNHLTLLIDDFHYAPVQVREAIARQLKDAIGKEFSAIVISLPHRADDAIRSNPDLSGRMATIALSPWNLSDLMEIAESGFRKLGIKASDELLNYISRESLASPQLIQYICLNIGLLLKKDGPLKGAVLTREIVEKAFRRTTANFQYREVANFLRKGPYSRGQQRRKYKTAAGTSRDLYELIIEAIAIDPPVTSLTVEELQKRLQSLIDEEIRIQLKTIRTHLDHLQQLIQKEIPLFRVLDWKDDCLYFLDPGFLFYLRWGPDHD